MSLNGNKTAGFGSMAVGEAVGLKVGKGVVVMVGVFDGRGVIVKASVRVNVGEKVGVWVAVGASVEVDVGVAGGGVGSARQPAIPSTVKHSVNVSRRRLAGFNAMVGVTFSRDEPGV